MVNQRRIPVGQLQDQRPQRTRGATRAPDDVLPEIEPIKVPPAPSHLSPRAIEVWIAYWKSPLREFALDVDRITIVERYVEYIDILDDAFRRYRRQRTVKGSMGQTRVGPAWQIVREATYAISGLEEQLGIGPRSRLRLNIDFGEAAETFEQWFGALARQFATPADGDEAAPGTVVEIDAEGHIVGIT